MPRATAYYYEYETATPAELAKAERNGLCMTAHRIRAKMKHGNRPLLRTECTPAEWERLTEARIAFYKPPPIITT